jgi:hypothetical protein
VETWAASGMTYSGAEVMQGPVGDPWFGKQMV